MRSVRRNCADRELRTSTSQLCRATPRSSILAFGAAVADVLRGEYEFRGKFHGQFEWPDVCDPTHFWLYSLLARFSKVCFRSGLLKRLLSQRMGKFYARGECRDQFQTALAAIRLQDASICESSNWRWMWETKTKDNVFVKIPVSVQYHVIPDKVYEAFYKLANPKQQISSYVFNVILGHVPQDESR